MTITLPLPPNMANARMHWREKQRRKKAYLLQCACVAAPTRPRTPPKRVIVSARLFVHSMMDTDNAVARLKWPLDWLVTRGFLADDSPAHLEWAGMPVQEIDRKRPRIELTLEPIT